MCPPERPHGGVSIPKIYVLCAGDERQMRPCRATRAGTQAPPLPNSIIFFHTIPHKQNNHLHTIHPNETNRPRIIHPNEINHPRAIYPNETVGAVPACPPERPRSGVSIPKIYALYAEMNDGCALVGRRGRAHRHRPYQSPLYIRVQSSQTISTTQMKRVNNPHNTSGAEMHRALPPPLLKIKKCVYVMISASP